MSVNQWAYTLDVIAPYAQHLQITGGEATLYPQFASIIQAIQARNIPFTLFTNGRWVEPAFIINLLQPMTQCTGLLISLHGVDAETHEHFTGVSGSFNETVQNIRRAAEAGLRVSTNTVLTRQNFTQIEAIIQLSRTLGAEQTVFNRYIGQPLAELDLLPLQLLQTIRQINYYAQTYGNVKVGTCVPHCFATSAATGCMAGELFCTIDPWGNVRPCNHAPLIAGNLRHESLHDIWHSSVMQDWRNIVPDTCTACSLFATCRGGCRADAMLKKRDHDPLIVCPPQPSTSHMEHPKCPPPREPGRAR
jgi:radical SAM protein with 4Fe4S-binding SPASM domain